MLSTISCMRDMDEGIGFKPLHTAMMEDQHIPGLKSPLPWEMHFKHSYEPEQRRALFRVDLLMLAQKNKISPLRISTPVLLFC